MLTIANLCRSFGGQKVLDGASWFVGDRARVGLVGANGSGKSTLLRLIAGLDHPDDGTISIARGATVGYLPQEVLGISGRSVLTEALDAFADVLALAEECRSLEQALSEHSPDDPLYSELMEAYALARERWDLEGSYEHESQAREVLAGLGFRNADLERDTGEFSGGWQMRIALAKLLLRRPTILLLDEPTNHLDLEARTWLEEFLAKYPHTVILVAHDRYFLDVTVERITEVSRGKLIDYKSSYTHYLAEKEERRGREIEAYRTQQEEITRLEAFISRFRYQASKAALVQSRIKYLEKLERVPEPEGGGPRIRFRFPRCERSGRIVLELQGVAKRYGELSVYSGLDLHIERARRVALVGPNGAGKSTLMKLLAGAEPPSAGERRVGHNVTIGYFAQDQTQILDPERSVLDEITAAAPYEMVPQVRQLLGAFLFTGDSVYKPIKVLSGGERNRLALCKLLLQPSNCLLLDEPTNHLDIEAKEVLLDALQHYEGTLVLVAHDRYILDHLPEEVIEVGAGHALRHIGNYENYLRHKAEEALRGEAATPRRAIASPAIAPVVTPRETEPPARSSADRAAMRRAAQAAARREREVTRLESSIAEKEEELAQVTSLINQPDFYEAQEKPHAIFSRYAQLKKEVEALYTKLARVEDDPSAVACDL